MRLINCFLILVFLLVSLLTEAQNRALFTELELQPDGKYYKINIFAFYQVFSGFTSAARNKL